MRSKYESAVRKLYQVNMWNPMKFGLENSEALYKLIGQPLASKPIIHIAGTNGKGSVAFKISRALREAGYNDGLFVSPHIASFRERMQIGGRPISEEEVATTLPMLIDLCVENKVSATFFELTTALAFLHFQKADAVVLEVGLGGRLDATNVITPSMSIITSIGLDHTRILGSTREEIALEKGGIMKPEVPVVVGPRVPHQVLQAHAQSVGSPFFEATELVKDAGLAGHQEGDFDAENSLVARAALMMLTKMKGFEKLDQRAINIGVSCRPPCRFQEMVINPASTGNLVIPSSSRQQEEKDEDVTTVEPTALPEGAVNVVLDVGHNPPALEQLIAKLSLRYGDRPLRFVLGMCRDKDTAGCLELIVNSTCNIRHLHFVQAQHPRAALPHELVSSAQEMGVEHELFSGVDMLTTSSTKEEAVPETDKGGDKGGGSVTRGIEIALHQALLNRDEVVVICGSVFMMAEARAALGIQEPRDSLALMEVAGSHLKKVQDVNSAAAETDIKN